MDQSRIEAELRDIAAYVLDVVPETLSPSQELVEYGMDSLTVIEFVMEIEKRYHIRVSEEQLDNFVSLEQAAAYLSTVLPEL